MHLLYKLVHMLMPMHIHAFRETSNKIFCPIYCHPPGSLSNPQSVHMQGSPETELTSKSVICGGNK